MAPTDETPPANPDTEGASPAIAGDPPPAPTVAEPPIDHLGNHRGQRISPDIIIPAPVPERVLAVEDPLTRQHAQDAWIAAANLDAALRLWMLYQNCYNLGCSIDDDAQERLNAVLPQLQDLQAVLDGFAGLSAFTEGEDNLNDAWTHLHEAFIDLIYENALALNTIGVRSPLFSGPVDEVLRRFAAVTAGHYDFRSTPPVLTFPRNSMVEAAKLAEKARGFLGLLGTAPAAALLLPKHGQVAPAVVPPPVISVPAATQPLTITVSLGDRDYLFEAPGKAPLAAPSDYKEMITLFVVKIRAGSPSEVVTLPVLNEKAGDTAGEGDKASQPLRKAFSRLNTLFQDAFGKPPDGRNWLVAERGRGYRLNSSVTWSLSPKLEKTLSQRSVFGHPTESMILEQSHPDRSGPKIPRSSRRNKPVVDVEDD